jgi:aspartyl-tRNA(Asn)/glutamyl-tRNA(Gln) amidotransferase subunit A
MYMGDIFTVFANLVGVPAASIPLFKHSYNLPFGVQVMAKRFDEVTLLNFSQELAQHFGQKQGAAALAI